MSHMSHIKAYNFRPAYILNIHGVQILNIHHHKMSLALAATLKNGFRRAVITAQDLLVKLAGQRELIQVPQSTGLDVNFYRPNREQVLKVCVRLCARVRTCRCVCLSVCACVCVCVCAVSVPVCC
jgi:hypothetical protein